MQRKIIIILSLFTWLSAQNEFVEPKALCGHAKTRLKILSARQTATADQEKIDATYYLLNISIDPDAEEIVGTVIADFNVLDSSLAFIELDLVNELQVEYVTVDGDTAAFMHLSDILQITMPEDIDTSVRVKIAYAGPPQASGFGSFKFSSTGSSPWIWTLSEPYGARSWWPCKDDPSDKADSADIIITVPGNLIVASNGTLVDVLEMGDQKTYFWQERYPIVTYLISLAIYPYYVWYDEYVSTDNDTMPLEFYVIPGNFSSLQANYLKTKEMITVFSELFGEYPFIKEKYGHAEFGWSGGMEHQTLTSLGGWGEDLIVHELAHQWWGDMITCNSFHHIWLNEGFATYSEALWWEAQYGWDRYHQDMLNNAYYGSGTIYVENPASTGDIFYYNLSYAKASWVLHMLRHVVGDSTFFDILKTYAGSSDFKHGTVTTEQFRDLCEDVAGIDLDYYFDQWIYGSYFPDYEVTWHRSSDSLIVQIEQVQTTSTFFRMPIDIAVTCSDTSFIAVVENTLVDQTFIIELPSNAAVTCIEIDPDDWILKQVRYMNNGREPYQPDQFLLQPAYPNPFNNSVTIPFANMTQEWISFGIYNLLGEEVWNNNDYWPVGYHSLQWDGRDADRQDLPSGVYFIRMDYTSGYFNQKILLLK